MGRKAVSISCPGRWQPPAAPRLLPDLRISSHLLFMIASASLQFWRQSIAWFPAGGLVITAERRDRSFKIIAPGKITLTSRHLPAPQGARPRACRWSFSTPHAIGPGSRLLSVVGPLLSWRINACFVLSDSDPLERLGSIYSKCHDHCSDVKKSFVSFISVLNLMGIWTRQAYSIRPPLLWFFLLEQFWVRILNVGKSDANPPDLTPDHVNSWTGDGSGLIQ